MAELKVMTNVLLVAPAVVVMETVSGAITGSRFRAASMVVASLLAFKGPVKSCKSSLNNLSHECFYLLYLVQCN